MDETEPPGEGGAKPVAGEGGVPPAAEGAEETKVAERPVETRGASSAGTGGPLTPTSRPPASRETQPSAEAGAEVLLSPGPDRPGEAPPATKTAVPVRRRVSLRERLREPEETAVEVPVSKIRSRSRRDFLLLGAGALAAAGGLWWLLPDETRQKHLTPRLRDWLNSLEARLGASPERRENLLDRALTFDDDVAEALYSPDRSVRTYSKSQVTPLRNNYNGATPDASYVPGWTLAVSGLASGRVERFTISDLLARFAPREQVTRICCVEGWSAVAWWGGLSFADFLKAFPPRPEARWARLDSAVNLDSSGEPDPYYVSIDLPTARHPQALLATHLSGKPLPVEHGAPLRLLVPMKLGLKNIKAITAITYSAEEPADYWNERGYSRYDGL
jgi:DMSO/TMAO reductase YedYZ molybdopterin-dependent catalytic subunit